MVTLINQLVNCFFVEQWVQVNPVSPQENSVRQPDLNQCRWCRALRNVGLRLTVHVNALCALLVNYVMRYRYFTLGSHDLMVGTP